MNNQIKSDQVKTSSIYFCSRTKSYCCIVGSYWDDGATLIACKYENDDITDELFITEVSCLTVIRQ